MRSRPFLLVSGVRHVGPSLRRRILIRWIQRVMTKASDTRFRRSEALSLVAGAGFEPAKGSPDGFTERRCPPADLRFRRSLTKLPREFPTANGGG